MTGRILRGILLSAVLAGVVPYAAAQAPAAAPAPVVREGVVRKISDRVFLMPDNKASMVPNVGIIVGDKATLVVDPGLGPKSGAVVWWQAWRLSRGADFYIVNTHFHPEHTTGEAAFHNDAMVLRAAAQQQEIDEVGLKWVQNFASRSPVIADALRGFTAFRRPVEIFEKEKRLDLGGVVVRLIRLGPGHTNGDTVVFVEGDRVLFSGDLAMSGLFPAFSMPQSSGRAWLESLDAMARLNPRVVIGAHYPAAEPSVIADYRDYLRALQSRVIQLKKQGRSADDVAAQARKEFAAKYPNWDQPARIQAAAAAFYREE